MHRGRQRMEGWSAEDKGRVTVCDCWGAYGNGTRFSSYVSTWWHLLPPLINKLYMKSIPAPPGGLLPLSSSSSPLFSSFSHHLLFVRLPSFVQAGMEEGWRRRRRSAPTSPQCSSMDSITSGEGLWPEWAMKPTTAPLLHPPPPPDCPIAKYNAILVDGF